MECSKCHKQVDQLYWHQGMGADKQICLGCLGAYAWDNEVGDKQPETDTFYRIKGREEANTFIASLDELQAIDKDRKVYRQRNSNNMIVVKSCEDGALLQCLDITIQVHKS